MSIKSTSARIESRSEVKETFKAHFTVYWIPFYGEVIANAKLSTVLSINSLAGSTMFEILEIKAPEMVLNSKIITFESLFSSII